MSFSFNARQRLMTHTPAITNTAFLARALLLGERLDLRGWENLEALATTPLAVAMRGGGVAILFRFGVVVFFGVASNEEIAFIDSIKTRLTNPYSTPERETLEIRIAVDAREAVANGTATLQVASVERLQLIADILAKSVVLALNESRVASTFDRIEPLARELQSTGRISGQVRELLKHIGATLLIDHMMVGHVAVSEKPELLWEHADLEGLFIRLEDEFEIRERHSVLEQKIRVISRTTETLLDMIQNRHSLRVEWYIVALIVIEVVLSVYGLWRGLPH